MNAVIAVAMMALMMLFFHGRHHQDPPPPDRTETRGPAPRPPDAERHHAQKSESDRGSSAHDMEEADGRTQASITN